MVGQNGLYLLLPVIGFALLVFEFTVRAINTRHTDYGSAKITAVAEAIDSGLVNDVPAE